MSGHILSDPIILDIFMSFSLVLRPNYRNYYGMCHTIMKIMP
jgi:hypothetical protein